MIKVETPTTWPAQPAGGTGGVAGSYPSGGFNDIIVGNNRLYAATPATI